MGRFWDICVKIIKFILMIWMGIFIAMPFQLSYIPWDALFISGIALIWIGEVGYAFLPRRYWNNMLCSPQNFRTTCFYLSVVIGTISNIRYWGYIKLALLRFFGLDD